MNTSSNLTGHCKMSTDRTFPSPLTSWFHAHLSLPQACWECIQVSLTLRNKSSKATRAPGRWRSSRCCGSWGRHEYGSKSVPRCQQEWRRSKELSETIPDTHPKQNLPSHFGPWNKSSNSIFHTKYVIPKSLKVGHWLGEKKYAEW